MLILPCCSVLSDGVLLKVLLTYLLTYLQLTTSYLNQNYEETKTKKNHAEHERSVKESRRMSDGSSTRVSAGSLCCGHLPPVAIVLLYIGRR